MDDGVRVVALALTPVKSLRLTARESIALGPEGVRENRRFYLVDERGRLVNGKHVGELAAVVADYDDAARRLALTFPDGRVVSGTVAHGPSVATRFFSSAREARLVAGPWSAALSEHAGRPLRLVEPDDDDAGGVDRGRAGAASLISRASLRRLEQEAGTAVDARRFRMLIEVDGIDAHAEDAWVGRELRIGEAAVRFHGHVGRCLVTSRDPDSGVVDLSTLELLGAYRREARTTEPLAFGIYGEVTAPGRVRVGDPVIAPSSR